MPGVTAYDGGCERRAKCNLFLQRFAATILVFVVQLTHLDSILLPFTIHEHSLSLDDTASYPRQRHRRTLAHHTIALRTT